MSTAEMRHDSIAEAHDALRKEGLVPPADDCPFIACSTDYRHRFERAYMEIAELLEPEDYDE